MIIDYSKLHYLFKPVTKQTDKQWYQITPKYDKILINLIIIWIVPILFLYWLTSFIVSTTNYTQIIWISLMLLLILLTIQLLYATYYLKIWMNRIYELETISVEIKSKLFRKLLSTKIRTIGSVEYFNSEYVISYNKRFYYFAHDNNDSFTKYWYLRFNHNSLNKTEIEKIMNEIKEFIIEYIDLVLD